MAHLKNLKELKISRESLELITESVAKRYSVLPVSVTDDEVYCIFPGLNGSVDIELVETIRFVANRKIRYDAASRVDLDLAIQIHYGTLLATIQNCEPIFKFKCPEQWSRMRVIDDPYVRFCEICQRNVYLCSTIEESQEIARNSECVAFGTVSDVTLLGELVEFVENAPESSQKGEKDK